MCVDCREAVSLRAQASAALLAAVVLCQAPLRPLAKPRRTHRRAQRRAVLETPRPAH